MAEAKRRGYGEDGIYFDHRADCRDSATTTMLADSTAIVNAIPLTKRRLRGQQRSLLRSSRMRTRQDSRGLEDCQCLPAGTCWVESHAGDDMGWRPPGHRRHGVRGMAAVGLTVAAGSGGARSASRPVAGAGVLVVGRWLYRGADAREAQISVGSGPVSRVLAPGDGDLGAGLCVLHVDDRKG